MHFKTLRLAIQREKKQSALDNAGEPKLREHIFLDANLNHLGSFSIYAFYTLLSTCNTKYENPPHEIDSQNMVRSINHQFFHEKIPFCQPTNNQQKTFI